MAEASALHENPGPAPSWSPAAGKPFAATPTCTSTSTSCASAGLLLTIDRPIDKDAELHPLVRWQYVGGIEEHERKAFLFTNVVDGRGRKYKFPGRRRRLRRQPRDLLRRHARDAGGGRSRGGSARSPTRSPPRVVEEGAVPGGRDRGRRAEGRGQRARHAADPGLHAGLRRRAHADRDQRHHEGSGDRHPEPRHLPRRAQGARPAGRAHGDARRRRGRLPPLPQAPEARRQDDAVRDRARLPAVRGVRRAA